MPGLQYRHKGAIWRITVQDALDPLDCVDAWLESTLTGDATLTALVATAQTDERILSGELPEGTPAPAEPEDQWIYGDVGAEGAYEPFVRVWMEAAEDVLHVFGSGPGQGIFVLHYGIAPIAQRASYTSLTPINNRIVELLWHTGPVTTAQGEITECQYLRPWRQAESEE